jgi:hypothetical protein
VRAEPADDPLLVEIRDGRGDAIVKLPASAPYEAAVLRWSYVLQRRRGWANRTSTRRAQAENALEELRRLGVTDEQLVRLTNAARLEVAVVDLEELRPDEMRLARRVPWEYLLSAGTSASGRVNPLSITRHLVVTGRAARRRPESVLFVESAPGIVAQEYDFSTERQLVVGALGFAAGRTVLSHTETAAELRRRVATSSPDVVHVAGVDTHEGRALFGPAAAIDDADGVVLRGTSTSVASVSSLEFAQLVTAGKRPPVLVAFNLNNSATELAAEAVLAGADAAIGFQDEIDEDAAEYFYAAFYREWRNHWDVSRAFDAAWRMLREGGGQLHGTGIVLWSATSAFEARAPAALRAGGSQKPGGTIVPVAARPGRPSGAERRRDDRPPVVVSADVNPEINYALLHNRMPIFRTFTLVKTGENPLTVDVTVELHVGSDSYPFRETRELGSAPLALANDVRIPLTSAMARSLRERVQSTLYLCVNVRDSVAFQKTFPVTLLPVDEWLDDGRQSAWLPSFVLPRDPAVTRIVDAAQRYLMALQDDPAAGFDGYQRVDPADPATTEAVDLQVRALWCALSYEFGLSYINPPPSYSSRTQRLRTPSDVLEGKRGTCIDLALLLAACLEYVDIYPALILLAGHAFPAYWRSEAAHDRFALASAPVTSPAPTPTPASAAGTAGRTAPGDGAPTRSTTGNLGGSRSPDVRVAKYGWQFPKQHFGQVMQSIQRGDLVPLETVDLTSRTSFDVAMQDGLENLRNKNEFDSLIDLLQARRNEPAVTPLPIIRAEH